MEVDAAVFMQAVRAASLSTQKFSLSEAIEGGGIPNPLALIVPPAVNEFDQGGTGGNLAGQVSKASALYAKVCTDVARGLNLIVSSDDAPRGLLTHVVQSAGTATGLSGTIEPSHSGWNSAFQSASRQSGQLAGQDGRGAEESR